MQEKSALFQADHGGKDEGKDGKLRRKGGHRSVADAIFYRPLCFSRLKFRTGLEPPGQPGDRQSEHKITDRQYQVAV